MRIAFKTIILAVAAALASTIAMVPAHAVICLDHSYTTHGSGAGSDAETGAKQRWIDTVRADAGKNWAVLNNAKNPNLSCAVKDGSIALRTCTFTATPCQGSLSKALIRDLPTFRTQ